MNETDQEFALYYTKALQYLSRHPRSEKEVRDNLKKKFSRKGGKPDADIIDGVIALLTKQKFINDAEFTRWWVRQRVDFKPRSVSLIKLELRQKGISQDILEEVFDKSETLNEQEMAKQIVQKKIGRYKHFDRKIIYQKLGQHLARRGFSWEVIRASIDDSLK